MTHFLCKVLSTWTVERGTVITHSTGHYPGLEMMIIIMIIIMTTVIITMTVIMTTDNK